MRRCVECSRLSDMLPRQRVCRTCQRSKDEARYRTRRAKSLPAPVEREVRESFIACFYCGHIPGECGENRRRPDPRLELDHIEPLYLGGSGRPENLVMACRPCNRSKGSKTVSEWVLQVRDGECRIGRPPIPLEWERW